MRCLPVCARWMELNSTGLPRQIPPQPYCIIVTQLLIRSGLTISIQQLDGNVGLGLLFFQNQRDQLSWCWFLGLQHILYGFIYDIAAHCSIQKYHILGERHFVKFRVLNIETSAVFFSVSKHEITNNKASVNAHPLLWCKSEWEKIRSGIQWIVHTI